MPVLSRLVVIGGCNTCSTAPPPTPVCGSTKIGLCAPCVRLCVSGYIATSNGMPCCTVKCAMLPRRQHHQSATIHELLLAPLPQYNTPPLLLPLPTMLPLL